jgi:hypothetical protein
LDAYAAAQLSLFLWGKEEDLDPGLKLIEIDFIGIDNNSNTPLVIKVIESHRSDQGSRMNDSGRNLTNFTTANEPSRINGSLYSKHDIEYV